MNRERIQRAINALAGLEIGPLNRFEMDLWLDPGWPSCGTSACAGGWLHALGTFAEEGYTCSRDGPYFGKRSGVFALAELFDISPQDALRIFATYVGPMAGPAARDVVVAKLRKLLEE